MMKSSHANLRIVRRGVTLVEFSLVAPIVFAMFFAAIEFSRVNMLRHSIESAAYEGCRRAIVPGATAEDAIDGATTILYAASAINATVDVEPANITRATKSVKVSVSVPLYQNTWVTPAFFGDTTITSSLEMRRENLDEYSGQ